MSELEHFSIVDPEDESVLNSAEGLRSRSAAGGSYSEKLIILSDGTIKLPTNKEDPMTSLFSCHGNESSEALMRHAQQIQERFPEFQFSFNKDPEGKWIEYTVIEQK